VYRIIKLKKRPGSKGLESHREREFKTKHESAPSNERERYYVA
jgi:hypothetical protein